jgi:hypothetical protein
MMKTVLVQVGRYAACASGKNMTLPVFKAFIAGLLLAGITSHSQADNKAWVGGPSGNWNTAGNWDPEGVPGAADAVVIAGSSAVSVTLDIDTQILALTLTNSHAGDKTTLLFDAWNRTLTASNVYVRGGGNISHPVNSDTNAPWTPDAGVFIVCTNITIDANGSLNVDARGYTGGLAYDTAGGRGPGGGQYNSAGGGYGGTGGKYGGAGGIEYGSADAPASPGSGGAGAGANGRIGGNGGGYVRIEASGTAAIDGTISANGQNNPGHNVGGGSGGGVHLVCHTLTGSGTVRADGGDADYAGGSGGGGRIAIYVSTPAACDITFSADRGYTPTAGQLGTVGTLYLSQYDDVLKETLTGSMRLFPDGSDWSPQQVTIAGERIVLPGDAVWSVAGDLRITDPGSLLQLPSNSQIRAANVIVSNRAGVVIEQQASFTNVGNITISGTSTVAFVCNHTTADPGIGIPGGIYANTLFLDAFSALDADAFGWSGAADEGNGYGPGGGTQADRGGGGGYGGDGGRGADAPSYGGPAYDAAYSNAPYRPGSGGAGGGSSQYFGGHGGGYIRLNIGRTAEIQGTISANGEDGDYLAGGGAGGGIYLFCTTLEGTGTIRANGGVSSTAASYGGGGGGGRIAINTMSADLFSGNVTADGGTVNGSTGAQPGDPGSVVWLIRPPSGTVLLVR